jgi:hypothetical protein
MKKLSVIVLVIICCFFGVMGQTKAKTNADMETQIKTFKKKKYYKVSYDKFTDKTNVIWLGTMLSGTGEYISTGAMWSMKVGFTFDKQSFTASPSLFILVFDIKAKDWKAGKNQQLYVLADTERFDLGEGERDSNISRSFMGEVMTNESLVYLVSADKFEKIVVAKKVEIKIAGHEFKVKDDALTQMKDLINLSKP